MRDSERKFLTVSEVAAILGLHQVTVYRMLNEKVIMGKKLDSNKKYSEWRVDSDWLDGWMRE
jgi:excisionase family DNA binding protein